MTDRRPDCDITTFCDAMQRVKKQYTPYLQGDARFILSNKVFEAIDAIKKEKQTKQEQPKPESKPEVIDTNPPPEPTNKILRVPSRDELYHQILYMDRSRIEPLFHAIDDLVNEVKFISDRLKKVEEKINLSDNESRGTSTDSA